MSSDPDDDYLLALAGRESVHGVISGDPDLRVARGPRVLTPRDVLELLILSTPQRTVLVIGLWNLHLRLAAVRASDSRLDIYREAVRSATGKLGGDPDIPVFNAPKLNERRVDVRNLNFEERAVCAFAIELDRRQSGSLHAEYAEDVDALRIAFEISDLFTELERLIAATDVSEQ
ncbi:hypothetical protein BH23ACT5_BH23ACT5_06710 [soil metagenome]